MVRLAFKKAFFDLWDNLFATLLVNLIFTLGSLGLAALPFLLGKLTPVLGLVFFPVSALAVSVLGGLATFFAKDLVFDGALRPSDILAHLAASWRASLVFGAVWLLLVLGYVAGIPFYNSLNPTGGFLFMVVLAWAAFFAAGMSLYYPGLNAQVEPHLKKLAVKSFKVFLANPGTSAVMALVFVVMVVLSVFTFGFFPGILGISIWLQVCFKFILAKYDWLASHPEVPPKKLPWAEVLAPDMEKVGPRSWKSLIFPWKD